MGDATGIEWTDATWNPTKGCSRISEGCRRCYAEQQAARIVRMGKGKPTVYDDLVRTVAGEARWTGIVRLDPDHLADPIRWKRPRRIFVASMSDPFHDGFSDEQIDSLFAVIALANWHTYQLLTKRAERMRAYVSDPRRPFKVLRAIDRLEVDLAMESVVEEWRPVSAYPAYQVSNTGSVRRSGRTLALSAHGGGYRQVALCADGVARTHLVHRLVLEAFDRPPRDDEEVAHRNCDRTDNRVANLRWATRAENMRDSARQGTAGAWMKGRATLSPEEIGDIRAARERGEKLATIAARFDIDKRQVSAIATGKIFKPAPLSWPLPQLWLGVSVENQDAADARIPELLATPAAVRFLSCEPLLGPVRLAGRWAHAEWCLTITGDTGACDCGAGTEDEPQIGVDWVIAGCESGPEARPCDVAWLRSLRDQCGAARAMFFLKQAVHSPITYGTGGIRLHTLEEITAGPGSKRKPGGIVGAPYLDGFQHLELPR